MLLFTKNGKFTIRKLKERYIPSIWQNFSSYINDVHVCIFSGILSYLKPGKGQQRILKVPHPARVKFMDRANLKVL